MYKNRHTPCAVIGAGLVGLCTALEFQRRGIQVTLIDSGRPGQGASLGNAGFLATESIDPLSSWSTIKSLPDMLFKKHSALAVPLTTMPRSLPWILKFLLASNPDTVSSSTEALAALNRKSVSAWQDCLGRIGRQDLLINSGYLLAWESSRGMDAAKLDLRHLHSFDISAELIQQQDIDLMEPALAGIINHALYFPGAYRVSNPEWISAALFDSFQKHGGIFLQQAVTNLKITNSEIHVTLPTRHEIFSTVVLCAGVKSADLLKSLGIDVPLIAERGYHLNLKGGDKILNRPVCSMDRRVFLSPLDTGLRIVGISELSGTELPPQPARTAALRYHGKQLFPRYADLIDTATEWMGMRPTLPDSIPVIDTHPKLNNLGFAFGHQHLGLTQAAITGRLITSKILGDPLSIDLNPFQVTRFSKI